MEERIIIIGSNGQIGTELALALRSKYGQESVVTSDIRQPSVASAGPFELINVLDRELLKAMFDKYKPTQVYLLAAVLSAVGEQNPKMAWDLNMTGLLHVLDLAVEFKVRKVFWPSSIAVFGPNSPKERTPQYCTMDPNTVYGFSKQAGERWCEYYFNKYGLDVRSIRYPGLISWKAAPGGGTTDYAIHIFHEALSKASYQCFLSADTALPMLYMEDAIRGTLALMEAPAKNLRIRSSYNLTGISLTPQELSTEIRKHIPDFTISYKENDPRQVIADSWPSSIDDSYAQQDWGWKPEFDITALTNEMLTNLKQNLETT
ncbi:NAD-dependent epimerase/dehydratase family protein [Olivibacter sp. SDN3]|uniref:NAD-dependent epimerase/dehydratase family protein n=1 Tax=Olivibacter sp. SDN3 TaxID=2764720 RepID=UPI0016516974|nr:NAD-dependent epimerase/dehydratase family protein [Olivibacter sp. SDN3]QNL50822.1 NAD-dependent epimerase/dehydratase family protein [Olivibacter sp. SDN3]